MLYDREHPSDITGIPTGFHDLDMKTSGFQPGDMVIVAGRPSMGKTAFALNIAEHVALESKLPVAIFSMEMPGTQLAMRFLSSVGRLDQHRVRTGRLNDDEWQRMTFALGKLHEAPIHIDETPALNSTELRARARRLYRQCGKLGLIVIDYLQLMSSVRDGENRATEISEISRSVKALAKELHVPVVALSQLSRNVESAAEQAAGDVRPARIRRHRAGRRRDHRHLPRRGLQPRFAGQGLGRDHHRQAAERPRSAPCALTFLGEYTRFENFAAAGSY
jgi:replicative DNA helicase